jgi:hypothetical protein
LTSLERVNYAIDPEVDPAAERVLAEIDRLGVQVTDTPDGPVWELR